MDILLVAADGALRHSIAFLLEAEGMVVRPCLSLAVAREAFRRTDRACVVVDADVLRDRSSLETAVSDMGSAIILIVEQGASLATSAITCIQKPLLGSALTQAVRQIVRGDGTGGTAAT